MGFRKNDGLWRKMTFVWLVTDFLFSNSVFDLFVYVDLFSVLDPRTGPTGTGPRTDWNWHDWNWTDRNRTARPDRTGLERHLRSRGFPSRIKDHGSWIKAHGSLFKDQGSRILDLGPCFGMNGHPGRDTDVILRLSKATIEDLQF